MMHPQKGKNQKKKGTGLGKDDRVHGIRGNESKGGRGGIHQEDRHMERWKNGKKGKKGIVKGNTVKTKGSVP
jgi:hypothetical protein